MRRRDFITLLGGAAAWPLAARAQQTTTPVVGILSPLAPGSGEYLLDAFRRGLGESSYIEGQNVTIDIVLPPAGSIGSRRWRPISCSVG
jgi:putative tryptophan/tyrosine transport system substrate-binding protein